MVTKTGEQFNNNGRTILPCDFIGRSEGSAFTHGGKRLSGSALSTLAVIKLQNAVKGVDARTTYSDIYAKTGHSSRTIAKNLKELTDDAILSRSGKSGYTIVPTFSSKNYIVIYDFLKTETLDFGGKVVKKLNDNEVLLLCNMIKHALNPNKKNKYYKGGQRVQGTFLNLSKTGAKNAIDGLIDTGCIYRGVLVKDSAGNEIFKAGKGKNNYEQSAYVVNERILKRCRRIENEAKKERKEREERAETLRKRAETKKRAEKPSKKPENSEEFTQHSAKNTSRARSRDEQASEIYRTLYLQLVEQEENEPPPDNEN